MTLLKAETTAIERERLVEVEPEAAQVGEQPLRQPGRGQRGVDDEEPHQQEQQVAVDVAQHVGRGDRAVDEQERRGPRARRARAASR